MLLSSKTNGDGNLLPWSSSSRSWADGDRGLLPGRNRKQNPALPAAEEDRKARVDVRPWGVSASNWLPSLVLLEASSDHSCSCFHSALLRAPEDHGSPCPGPGAIKAKRSERGAEPLLIWRSCSGVSDAAVDVLTWARVAHLSVVGHQRGNLPLVWRAAPCRRPGSPAGQKEREG